MNRKRKREEVYKKYDGHCAYCGRIITISEMQVDHFMPKRYFYYGAKSDIPPYQCDDVKNLMPSCRRCNHYKRAESLQEFREKLLTLHERVKAIYICKVAEDYGIIKIVPFDGNFYFEEMKKKEL